MRTSRRAERTQLATAAAALVALALGLPARAADVPQRLTVHRAKDGSAWVDVPVRHPKKNGPRTVAVRVPGLPDGVTSLAGTATPARDPARPGTTTGVSAVPPVTPVYGPDDARQFPPDAPTAPGTITSVAGGFCDGYPATEATITPLRVAWSNGTLWWLEDDGSYYSKNGHDRGSLELRRLTPDGRVKSVAPLIEPEEGRYDRLYLEGYNQTAMLADGKGGVYVALSYTLGPNPLGDAAYGDEPPTTTILHVAPDGTREVVAGGGKPPAAGRPIHAKPGGEPAVGAPLFRISGMAVDPEGSLFFVEGGDSGTFGVTVSFVNRSPHSVIFYGGTALSVAIQPGRLATIAGDLYSSVGNIGFANGGGHGEGGSARKAYIPMRTNLAYHNGFLYLLPLFQDSYSVDLQHASPAEVEAINLGLDTGSTRAGVDIPNGAVDRLAGAPDPNGSSPLGPDGVPARTAVFSMDTVSWEGGLAVAPDGDVLVSDTLHNAVRRIDDKTGTIRTIAGTGTYGYDGDGPATAHRLAYPLGVTTDKKGDVYVADVRNQRIRRIDAEGRLVTVAGRGATPCGAGHLATGRDFYGGMYLGEQHDVATDSHGRIFVADAQYAVVHRIGPDGRVEASVGVPQGCAYVGNSGEYRAAPACTGRVADGDGGPWQSAHLRLPNFLAVDSYDNLYVADSSTIRYVNFQTRPVSVLGVTVPANAIATVYAFGTRTVHVTIPPFVDTDITLPIGDLVVDDDGSLLVGDPALYKVWRIDRCGRLVAIAGTGVAPTGAGQGDDGPALRASVAPVGIEIDRKQRLLYLYDTGRTFLDAGGGVGRARIRVVNLAATPRATFGTAVGALGITTIAGGAVCSNVCSFGDGGPAKAAGISGNSGLALSRGRLYFADPVDNRVRVILADGTVAGIAAPWPEARGAQRYGFQTLPPSTYGTRGDGGRALDAWVALERIGNDYYAESSAFYFWPAVLTTTLSGDLLIGDDGGRVRRVADPMHAPLRLSASVPGLDGAGVGFSSPLVLRHPMPNVGDVVPLANTTYGSLGAPDLVSYGGTSSLVGSLGGGGGCVLWTLTMNVDGKGKDGASDPAGVGAGGIASPVGGRGCRVTGTSAAAVTVASTQDVRDGSGARYETGLVVSSTDDNGRTWRSTVADPARLGATDLGAVAVAGNTLVYRGSDGTLHAARAPDGVTYADAGSPGRDAVVLGDAVASGGVTFVAYATERAVVLARSTGGGWSATTVASLPPRSTVSPPALAVDRAGTPYVTWSRAGVVYLAARGAVRQVADRGTLPSVAAGNAGEVVVAWYGSPEPRVKPDDPYAKWYVYTARYRPGSSHPLVEVASAAPVHAGPFTDVSGPSLTAASGIGPVRVRVGTAGRAEIAYRADSGLAGNGGSVPALGFLRACAGAPLVPAASVKCTLNPPDSRDIADYLTPSVPDTPPVGGPILGDCSPRPPAFAAPPPPPAPRTRGARPLPPAAGTVAAPAVTVVGAVVPPVEQAPPGEPETIAGSENVTAAQHGTVAQPGYGAAPDEEEQTEIVAATERHEHQPAGDLLAISALLSAVVTAAELRRRSRQAAAPATCAGTRSPRPGPSRAARRPWR